MENLLKIKTEQEIYKVIGKDLFAYTESTQEKRNISEYGCDLLSNKIKEIDNNKESIKELEKRIEELKQSNIANYKLVGDLYKCGFCDKSSKKIITDTLTGNVVEVQNVHICTCRNNKGGN